MFCSFKQLFISAALYRLLASLAVGMVTIPVGLESFITFIFSSFLFCFASLDADLGFLLNSFFTAEKKPLCRKDKEKTILNSNCLYRSFCQRLESVS